MEQNIFLTIPEYIWNGIFGVISTLGCGIVVALFTSTFLKKKEERTRIIGEIVDKRVAAEKEILNYFEKKLFKLELNIKNSNNYNGNIDEILENYDFPVHFTGRPQYAEIFESTAKFKEFFHGFEDLIMANKLWLDSKVRDYLIYMHVYYSFFISIPLLVKSIPLPRGKELTAEEYAAVCNKVLLLLGISFDYEINVLSNKLYELIVDSIYRLDLKSPRKSIQRNNMLNNDFKRISKRLSKNTILFNSQDNIYHFIMDMVYLEKNFDPDSMTDDEYEKFYAETSPEDYKETKAQLNEFETALKTFAKERGFKFAHKKDIEENPEKYKGMYGISLKDLLEGMEPDIL